MRRLLIGVLKAAVTAVCLSGTASAQAIVQGVVTDSSGAVLPGVTVETTSTVDIFNVLNLSSVTSRDTTFTPTGVLANNWQRAQSVESARFAKFYVQFDF